MTDATTITDWMNGYLRAWDSNAPDDIRALFTEDAEYRYHPYDEQAVTGHDAIVASWLSGQDQAGDHDFTWEILGIDGDTAFIDGTTKYQGPTDYRNLWVVPFADDGRARSFTEWYMELPRDVPSENAQTDDN